MDFNLCTWLMEHADIPIQYRVTRELLRDNASKLETPLLEHPLVKRWFKNLMPPELNPKGGILHGSADFFLENALPKLVRLGLHSGIPQLVEALATPIEKMEHYEDFNSYFGIVKNVSCQYRSGKLFPAILTANFLAHAGVMTNAIKHYLLGSLNEMYHFLQVDLETFYLNEDERSHLKNVPNTWKQNLYFIRPEITRQYGFSYPLTYDMTGLYQLYELNDSDVNNKIDAIMKYIATDVFHSKIADGYGTLVEENHSYHAMGWDPKYPGWFDMETYLNGMEASRVLNYALYLSKYPIAVKSAWMKMLLHLLEKYRTDFGTYIFPPNWLRETTGNAVLGRHMSFGENRRNKEWLEIESTFYVLLLRNNIYQL